MEELRFEKWNGQDVEQVAVVPYRMVKGGYEFCLVTTSSEKWTFPKGCVKSPQKLLQTAELEAWEEAGVRGDLESEPFGCYELVKGSDVLRAAVFLMHVTAVESKWPEKKERRRIWVGPVAASTLLISPALRETLQQACWQIELKRADDQARAG